MPELCELIALEMMEGAGKAGSSPLPWPACRQESRRQSPQARPRHPGLPCANGLRLIRDLLGDRLSCPRRSRARQQTQRTWPQHREARTTRFRRPRQRVRPHVWTCCAL